jgi:hypothetical protein
VHEGLHALQRGLGLGIADRIGELGFRTRGQRRRVVAGAGLQACQHHQAAAEQQHQQDRRDEGLDGAQRALAARAAIDVDADQREAIGGAALAQAVQRGAGAAERRAARHAGAGLVAVLQGVEQQAGLAVRDAHRLQLAGVDRLHEVRHRARLAQPRVRVLFELQGDRLFARLGLAAGELRQPDQTGQRDQQGEQADRGARVGAALLQDFLPEIHGVLVREGPAGSGQFGGNAAGAVAG